MPPTVGVPELSSWSLRPPAHQSGAPGELRSTNRDVLEQPTGNELVIEGNKCLMTKIRPATVYWEDNCTVLREMLGRGSCQRAEDTWQAGKVKPKHMCLA